MGFCILFFVFSISLIFLVISVFPVLVFVFTGESSLIVDFFFHRNEVVTLPIYRYC